LSLLTRNLAVELWQLLAAAKRARDALRDFDPSALFVRSGRTLTDRGLYITDGLDAL
jgi:hypothetical protein